MDIKEKLINGFITEISTNHRSDKFNELLLLSNEDTIVEAYQQAVTMVEMQSKIINYKSNIKLFTEFDLNQKKKTLNKLLDFPTSTFIFCIVEGDSMVQTNIDDGDILVVEKNEELVDNSIIVVKINEKYYVKKYKCIDGERWLYSENYKYLPVKISVLDNFNVIGVVRDVIKNYQ